jgi:hypothetical protein
LSAQTPADLPAIEAGQQDIKDDQIVRSRLPKQQSILTIRNQVHRVMAPLQPFLEILSENWMVLDD